MRTNDTITERLWRIAEPVCTSAGYELIDVVLTQSRSGWVLRVFIDHPPSTAPAHGASAGHRSDIGFDDCERVSRELSAVLDVEDPIDHPYNLEVSSPGLDRPLRRLFHFQRYLGHVVKVVLRNGLDGRRNFKGTLISIENSTLPSELASPGESHEKAEGDVHTLILNVDGTEYRLPFSDIENARLVPDWDAVFQQGQRR